MTDTPVDLVYFKAIPLWRMRSQDHKTKNKSLPLDRPRGKHSENINAWILEHRNLGNSDNLDLSNA